MSLSNEFIDNQNRKWAVVLSLGKAYSIDAADKTIAGRPFTLVPPSEDFFEKDVFQTRVLIFIIWNCIKEKAGKIPLTEEDFYDSLDGEQIHYAKIACWKALMDFFPERAIYLSEIIEAQNYAQGKLDEVTTVELRPSVRAMIDNKMEDLRQDLRKQKQTANGEISS